MCGRLIEHSCAVSNRVQRDPSDAFQDCMMLLTILLQVTLQLFQRFPFEPKAFHKQTVLCLRHTNVTDHLLCLEVTNIGFLSYFATKAQTNISVIVPACPRQTLPQLRNLDSLLLPDLDLAIFRHFSCSLLVLVNRPRFLAMRPEIESCGASDNISSERN